MKIRDFNVINAYSQTWFKLFLETRPYTAQETAFVRRNLPNPPHRRVLDLGCGQGRHTNRLAEQGYDVVGLDLNEAALSVAQSHAPSGATYVCKDMRDLAELPGEFDAVISLWQSFGYFDEATNHDVFKQISRKLLDKGRFILDIYNRDYWEKHQGSYQLERQGVTVQASNVMKADRLTARLDYRDGTSDVFEWQLYTPDEICNLAADFQLHCLFVCTECDEQKSATPEKPSMQLVLGRDT